MRTQRSNIDILSQSLSSIVATAASELETDYTDTFDDSHQDFFTAGGCRQSPDIYNAIVREQVESIIKKSDGAITQIPSYVEETLIDIWQLVDFDAHEKMSMSYLFLHLMVEGRNLLPFVDVRMLMQYEPVLKDCVLARKKSAEIKHIINEFGYSMDAIRFICTLKIFFNIAKHQ